MEGSHTSPESSMAQSQEGFDKVDLLKGKMQGSLSNYIGHLDSMEGNKDSFRFCGGFK